jgi:N,N-dimethylformamidase
LTARSSATSDYREAAPRGSSSTGRISRLGTPPNALILARSEGHQSHFVVGPEELLTHVTTLTGEPAKALIRAEIVYFDTEADGAVFSTGSITFCGSLSHNHYDNKISRMLENVLRRFAGDRR